MRAQRVSGPGRLLLCVGILTPVMAQRAPYQVEAILDMHSAWGWADDHPWRPNLSSAALAVERDGERWGFRIKAGAGELFRSTMASDPWKGPNRFFTEGYLTLKPLPDAPVRIDAGKFNASPGAEPEEAADNFNYTRSLVSDLALPAYHFGVRGSVQVSKPLTVGAALINGWDNVIDNNRGKTFSLNSTWTGKGWTWSQAFLYGPELDGSPNGRSLYDVVLTRQFRLPVSAHFEYAEGCDHLPRFAGQPWRGWSAAAQWKTSSRWSVAGRTGWFADPFGAASGQPRHLSEMTLTVDFRPARLLTWRNEYRRDWDRPVGSRSWDGGHTFVTALLFVYRREI
jgi:hypothetical protein